MNLIGVDSNPLPGHLSPFGSNKKNKNRFPVREKVTSIITL